jgi:hypothetical protein
MEGDSYFAYFLPYRLYSKGRVDRKVRGSIANWSISYWIYQSYSAYSAYHIHRHILHILHIMHILHNSFLSENDFLAGYEHSDDEDQDDQPGDSCILGKFYILCHI